MNCNYNSCCPFVHRLSEFLADAAQRIMILEIVFKRVINRYHKLLLYMGIPLHFAKDMKVNSFCKIVSEFALEYRTTREKVTQQLAKKANQRERKKTRGKMIVDVSIRHLPPCFTKFDKSCSFLYNLLVRNILFNLIFFIVKYAFFSFQNNVTVAHSGRLQFDLTLVWNFF